jgi:thioredoxin 1
MPVTLSKTNFKTEIMKTNNLSVVQFKVEWSGACQIIDPVYKELSKSYKGQVNFFSVDADKERDLYREFGISELPTILFFKSGQLIDHAVGLTSKNKLIAKIENALATLNYL